MVVAVADLVIVMVHLHQIVMVPLQEEAAAMEAVGADGVAASTNGR